ncbi:MAG: hypothetical protein K2K42_03320, partial [Eubacterium sp.]|nr:hypothetical protein [Eubacterium sp.]
MIMYELLEGISFDDLVNTSGFQMFYLVLWFVCFVLYRIFLCLTVYSSAKEKQIKCRPLWSLFTFLFGIIVPIIYAIVNRKNKAVKRYKCKNVFLMLSIVLIILSYSGGIWYNLSYTGEFGPLLNPTAYSNSFDVDFVGVYENDKGNKVIYDKMGKEYLYEQENMDLLYYDVNGNSYKWADDMFDTIVSIESGKEYKMEDYLFCIDKD